MTINPNDYCHICGEDTFVWVEGTPVCVNHFNDWLATYKEEHANNRRARSS